MFDINKFCSKKCKDDVSTASTSTNNTQITQRANYAQYIRNHMKTNISNSISGGKTPVKANSAYKSCIDMTINIPVLQLYGEKNVTQYLNTPYNDPGAYTNSKGTVGTIQKTSTLDVNNVGNYFITYSISNIYGFSGYVIRFIKVVNIPGITLNGSSIITLERYSTYFEFGVSSSEAVSISISNDVNTSIVGTYIVTYTVTNILGGSNSTTRTVNIVDTTPPTITLVGNNPFYLVVDTTFNDPGIEVNNGIFDSSSTDLDINTIGTYTKTYIAKDEYNNSANMSRTIIVQENISPIIDIYDTIDLRVNSDYVIPTPIVTYGYLDDISSNIDMSTLGTYYIIYNASNIVNLTSTKTVTVNVINDLFININGGNYVYHDIYTAYNDAGAVTNTDVSLSVLNNVIEDELGIYDVVYTITDRFGNSFSKTRLVEVIGTQYYYVLLDSSNIDVTRFYNGHSENINISLPDSSFNGLPILSAKIGNIDISNIVSTNYGLTGILDLSNNNSIGEKSISIQYELLTNEILDYTAPNIVNFFDVQCMTISSQLNVVYSNDGNKYTLNNDGYYDDTYVYGLYNGEYTITNVPENHPMAILNTDISYSVDNSQPFIINVSGGSVEPYSTGDYYVFTDALNNTIQIKNGNFKFMRGRIYHFINIGISTSYSFTINTTSNATIQPILNGLKLVIERNVDSSFVDVKYTSPFDSTMEGSLQVLMNSMNDIVYDYYYGNILVSVSNNFGVSSVYCYYHGYMGGEHILKYSDSCNSINHNISISNKTINEDVVIGTVVGTFTTNDLDNNNTFTYTLNTSGVPFVISKNQLLTSAELDYETQTSYTISVSSNDGSNIITQSFTIIVNDVNESNVTCITQPSSLNVIINSGFKYIFNGITNYDSSRTFGLYNGTYTINNIPSAHPVAILNNGIESSIFYTGDANSKLSRSVTNTTRDGTYDFYYGTITITVSNDFNQASIYCYYHGYMGGENLLVYDSQCQV